MTRPRKTNRHLPAKMYFKHGRHWYVSRGKWTPLAVDVGDALKDYADIVQAPKGGCGELVDATLAEMKSRKGDAALAPNTLSQYAQAAKVLKEIFFEYTPQRVKQRHVVAIRRSLKDTPNWCNRILSFARQVFDRALEDQEIDSNPFVGVKRLPEGKRTRLIEWEEWDKIRAVSGLRLQLIMDMMFLTDQRIGDVLGIDERDGRPEGIYFKQQKTGKELIIAWNPQLREAWDKARALHSKVVRVDFKDDKRPRPLFRTRHGSKPAYKTVYDQWVRACDLAKIEDCNIHDNRAFSATEAKRQGLNPQKTLGHSTERNTGNYLRDREVEVVEGPKIKKKSA